MNHAFKIKKQHSNNRSKKHKDRTPFEAAQIDSPFCSEKGGNLKSIHKYYSHLQLQIHVNRVTFGETVNEMIPYDK